MCAQTCICVVTYFPIIKIYKNIYVDIPTACTYIFSSDSLYLGGTDVTLCPIWITSKTAENYSLMWQFVICQHKHNIIILNYVIVGCLWKQSKSNLHFSSSVFFALKCRKHKKRGPRTEVFVQYVCFQTDISNTGKFKERSTKLIQTICENDVVYNVKRSTQTL